MKDSLKQYISKFNKFDQDEIELIVKNTQLESFKKGEIILREGQVCSKCYFVIDGCVRQYQIVDGEEKTTAFFTEGQAAVMYSSYLKSTPSEYYLSCVENSILTAGTREAEQELHKQYPKLEYLVHTLMPHDLDKAEKRIALLNNYKPQERYLKLMETQPEILGRVPLHQLASYIGVTPESLSRIRKRILEKRVSK